MPREIQAEIVYAAVEGAGTGSEERRLVALSDEEVKTPTNAVPPPLSLTYLSVLSDASGTRTSCIDAVARNTVGLGYQLVVPKQHMGSIEDEDAHLWQARRRLEGLARRDRRSDRPSFTEQLYRAKYDEEECGNGYLDVSRNRLSGEIDGLYYVPGQRVLRLKDFSGYLLMPVDGDGWSSEAIRYYNFGEKVQYDDAGRPTGKLAKNGKRWANNELLPFKRMTSKSRDYGLPRDYSLVYDYLADKLAAENNIAFFEAGGTPAKVIFVRGEETQEGDKITFRVPSDTPRHIAQTLKGTNGQRVAIVPLPPGTEVDAVDLGKVSDRDMGFVEYRADLRSRVLHAFRMSPAFIADFEDAGRYTAEVERAITLEQVFDPEQDRYEDRLGWSLLQELFGGTVGIEFTALAVEGNAQLREAASAQAEHGTITNGEHRESYGKQPLKEADEASEEIEWGGQTWKSAEPAAGEVPFGWNSALVSVDNRPRGADNRTLESDDQRGLRPGVGGRTRRTEDPPERMQRRVEQGAERVASAASRGTTRARRRARRAADED